MNCCRATGDDTAAITHLQNVLSIYARVLPIPIPELGEHLPNLHGKVVVIVLINNISVNIAFIASSLGLWPLSGRVAVSSTAIEGLSTTAVTLPLCRRPHTFAGL